MLDPVTQKRIQKMEGLPFFLPAKNVGDVHFIQVKRGVPHLSVVTRLLIHGVHDTHAPEPVPEALREQVLSLIVPKVRLKPDVGIPENELARLQDELASHEGLRPFLEELLQRHKPKVTPVDMPGLDRLRAARTQNRIFTFLTKPNQTLQWLELFSYLHRVHALAGLPEEEAFQARHVNWVLKTLETHDRNVLTAALQNLEHQVNANVVSLADQRYTPRRKKAKSQTPAWRSPEVEEAAETAALELAAILKRKK